MLTREGIHNTDGEIRRARIREGTAPAKPPSLSFLLRGSTPCFASCSSALLVSSTLTSAGLLPSPRNAPIATSSCANVKAEFCLLLELVSWLCAPHVSNAYMPLDVRTALTSTPQSTWALHCITADVTPLPGDGAHFQRPALPRSMHLMVALAADMLSAGGFGRRAQSFPAPRGGIVANMGALRSPKFTGIL